MLYPECFRDFLIRRTTKPPPSQPTLPPRSTLKTFTYTYRGPPPTTTTTTTSTTTTTTTTTIWYNLAPPTTANSSQEDHTYYPVEDESQSIHPISLDYLDNPMKDDNHPDPIPSVWPIIDNEDKVADILFNPSYINDHMTMTILDHHQQYFSNSDF